MTEELSTTQKPTYMQITVSGKTYNCAAQEFPVESLKLDPGNGRLEHLSKKLSQQEIFDKLTDEEDTKKLRDSIAYNHGLMEQPFVKLLSEEDDFQALIREGNRRSVALQLILDGIEAGKLKLDPKDFKTVKVWVYPNIMPEEHQLLHIANMHNSESGKKNWNKLDQAAFITNLRDKDTITDDDIVKGLQISKSTLFTQARAYKRTMKYGEIYGHVDSDWKLKYSSFERLYAQRALKDFHSEEVNMEFYMKWVSEGRIPYAHKVNKIKTILLDPKLKSRFEKAKIGSSNWKLEDALLDAERNQKIKDSTKEISRKCDQAVNDLNDFLSELPTHKLDDMVGSKMLQSYEECITRLEKYVRTVDAAKKR